MGAQPAFPKSWELPVFLTCSEEELAELSKEELIEKILKLRRNKKIALKNYDKDLGRMEETLLKRIKADEDLQSLNEERKNSYWGGENDASQQLSLFLDPRVETTFKRLSKKKESTGNNYDCLYQKLKEALPDESVPTQSRRENVFLQQLAALKDNVSRLKKESSGASKATAKAKHAIVRANELDAELLKLQKDQRMLNAWLWGTENYAQYINMSSRCKRSKKKIKELEELEGEQDGDMYMDDLEEVDDVAADPNSSELRNTPPHKKSKWEEITDEEDVV